MALMVLSMFSCVEKEPVYGNFPGKDVDFTYNVDGDEYTLDFYVVSTIKFNNTSSKSGSVTWDFGDGSTSSDQNPTHKYAQAGLYNVTLTVDGVGQRTYPLLIYDIAPVLSVVEQSAETVVINEVTVLLDIALPNPEDLECKYVWKFPEGTTLEDGTAITEFTGYSHSDGSVDNPGRLKFKNIGSQKIELQTWFDVNGENRRLEDSYVNVQVGSSIPCPTLYYAVMGGNIKAYKLIEPERLPPGTKNMPFDMGVSSGNMPTNLVFATVEGRDYVYILDCGKQYYYVNDENGVLGDGKISVMTADGTDVSTMVTNVGGQAFNDPFQGCADQLNGYLYYTDRNTGIRRLPLTTRGERETTVYSSTAGYFCVNNMLNYYGNGIAYGAIHTGILQDKNGVFWWGKNYSGNGIYRFRTTDIGEASATKTGPIPFPIVLQATQPRAFTIDEELNNLYVWMCKGGTPGPGFTCYPLPGASEGLDYDKFTTYITMEANPENTTADEGVYTTQFAVDMLSHYVYFGFRAASTESTYTTGLKYFDPTTKKVMDFNGNKERILGLCINPRTTQLF
jgi:PKD repeat protein